MSGERVLVVDDEPQIRRALRSALTAHGYDVAVAEDGAAALETIATWAPDAIVLDLVMPGVDGFEVLRRDPHLVEVPIIVLSARGQEADKVARARPGCRRLPDQAVRDGRAAGAVAGDAAAGDGRAESPRAHGR